MINRIIEFALRQRVFVMIGAVALIAAGIWSATKLPIDAVPDITNVQVQINTVVPAVSPEEVERQVTFPIETEMAGLQGLEEIRSLSKFGLSQLTMVFSEDTDIYRARQLVSERLVNVAAICRRARNRGSHPSPRAWAKFISTRSITNRARLTSRRRVTSSCSS
jgi:cobalt-zinc-cadmium resistance protein CzcA